MVTAREMDLLEQSYTGRGEAFFHVSGAGHEGTAVLAEHLGPQDWLHCHYRDKALMLARGLTPRMFFLSLFNKDESHSRGRQMNAHMSAPDLKVLSLVGPVGNSALHAVGVAEVVKDQTGAPVVLCGLGDGMTQESEVLEAIGHAVRNELPVLFVVQDNAFAISTQTKGQTFYSMPQGRAEQFYGIPIEYLDGRQPHQCYDGFGRICGEMRRDRAPRIVVFEVDRLSNHTNADDQRVYRSPDEIALVNESGDPIIHFQKYLIERGIDRELLYRIPDEIRAELAPIAEEAFRSAEPRPFLAASAPLPPHVGPQAPEYRGDMKAGGSSEGKKPVTMLEAIRGVLGERMAADERVHLFGEDLEDPKGDVFGVTKGLTTRFPGRVRNSPLSESLIVGESIGEALAGRRPVAFLQFADFLPIAYNQIVSELGSMYWRSDGGWQAPVIVMITCGGYKPGLGPFHASSLESIATHTPGIDVVMPSTAGDAAGLLNAAFESGRPTLFFYPKTCLNDRDNGTSPDLEKHLVPLGRARTVQSGDDISFVCYGNTVALCLRAAAALASVGVGSDIIDLRSLMPWDEAAVLESVRRTRRVIVTHEDNHSAGFGAEVLATLAEKAGVAFSSRRVTRPDTYVPCNFPNQLEVLPSYRRILETAVEMLGGTLEWEAPIKAEAGIHLVEAIGSSPSDESVTVVEWKVKPGEEIGSGDILAELEADKAAIELKAQVGGTFEEVLVPEGELVKVGAVLAKVRVSGASGADREHYKQITREDPGTPVISGIAGGLRGASEAVAGGAAMSSAVSEAAVAGSTGTVAAHGSIGIVDVVGARGSRVVSNEEIAQMCPDWTPDDILKRTGIHSRPWVAEGETAVSLAVRAARTLFERNGMSFADIDLLLCTTGTPAQITPSTATLIHHELAAGRTDLTAPAYDLSAACSGYLYALQVAYDYLSNRPRDRVLLITTEVLSPMINTADPGTAPIFADAATATLLTGAAGAGSDLGAGAAGGAGAGNTGAAAAGAGSPAQHAGTIRQRLRVKRPVLAALGESGETLRVPTFAPGACITMDGPTVFVEAVKDMILMLERACAESGITANDLDLIVPHQANQRIINAVRQRVKAPKEKMYSNIEYSGNTSSSTIPLCLEEILSQSYKRDTTIGLAAFGGGFTFAGGLLEVL
ncbi:MAG: transketolase [Spirochaetaceae bacterium]|nr:MAG: transketolase [Spirochaetaceae bacterium]